MWRNFAKQAASSKTLKFSSNPTKLPQDSNFLEKIRHSEIQTCLNPAYPHVGFRRIGVLAQYDRLCNPSFANLTNPFGVSSFLKGYATAAAQAIPSTDESDLSGSDELQELIEEMNKHHQKMESQAGPQPLKRTVAGMGVAKYTMLKKRQIKMETEAWEQAAKEYQELLLDMCEQKLAPNLPYVKSLFLGWFEPLRDAIVAEQELCNQKNHRLSHLIYFDELPADMMAVITMHKLMGLLMTNTEGTGNVRVVQAACAIGEAIEQEVNKLRILSF